jgi:hypothetical protein
MKNILKYTLIIYLIACFILLASCATKREYSNVELEMKNNKLFPMDTNSLCSFEIQKITYKDGLSVDTSFCNFKEFNIFKDSENTKIYFLHRFADAMSLFKKHKIYKYNRVNSLTVKKNGFEYLLKYKNECLVYYFEMGSIPKNILELDNELMENGVFGSVP